MGRMYGEPVEVQTNADGRPVRFAWRGRLYAVHAVIEHWVVNREWWRDPDAVLPRPAGPGRPPVPGQPEMLHWRVEAAAGQGMPPGSYELRRDVSAGTWTLRRVAD